jgi:hypothetical protein
MSGKRKPYFDNNWQEYKDAPDDMFHTHTFEEVMSWKVGGWELPSSVCCVIRATDLDSALKAQTTVSTRVKLVLHSRRLHNTSAT